MTTGKSIDDLRAAVAEFDAALAKRMTKDKRRMLEARRDDLLREIKKLEGADK